MPDENGTDGITIPGDVTTVDVARLAPSVCGVATWPEKVLDTRLDLSVATRANGAAIVSLPITGGAARGMVLDQRMAMVHDQSFPKDYEKVGISFAANRYVSTTTLNGSTSVWMMGDDLTTSDRITTVPGTVLAEQPFVLSGDDLIMPVGDEFGVTINRFADSYEPRATYRLAKTDAVEALTAASSGSTAVMAWSTKDHCFMGQTDGFTMSSTPAKASASHNPRLALDTASLAGVLVFDSPEGVRMTLTDGTDMFGRSVIAAHGSSPRAVFDGKNFWVSWVSDRGQVIVGIVDTTTRQVTTTAIIGPRPFRSSYELAIVKGSPWVFTVDGDGYSGHRLCLEQY